MAATVKEERAVVAATEQLGAGFILQRLQAPKIAAHAQPGQFIMIRPQSGFDPLLRRPLGILDAKDSSVWLYFQVRGRGTALLAGAKPGDSLDLLGPLGKPFPDFRGKNILLIAGGRGIVPLFFWGRIHGQANRTVLVYGGRCREEIHLLKGIESLALEKTYLYSEDGSIGRRGKATDGLAEITAAHDAAITFSCGPEAMLHSVHDRIGGRGFTNYVSLESLMGCGFGICHSCAVPAAAGGYLKACDDGPVFRMEELQWPT